ncbi:MAG: hypothetical protein WD669_09215 [Pirellulales bacterium]
MSDATADNDGCDKPRTKAVSVCVRVIVWTYAVCCFAVAMESLYENSSQVSLLWPYAKAIGAVRSVASHMLPFALVGLLLFPIVLAFAAMFGKLDRYDALAAVLILIASGFAIIPGIQ